MKLNTQEKKIVGLAALGGMLEFYDFIIYGIFSVYFAHQFFPSGNEMLSIIESYVVFVLGYIARPIGGIIFSHIGDEYGRKKVLIVTIILMGLASLGIGVMPTYQQIGIFAPIGLLLFRLIQGLALGGELPSTYVYINESMRDKEHIGFGITMTGVNSGLLLGMLINQLMNSLFDHAELTAYGWRIPFIIGGALCLVSYKIRRTLHETTAFEKIQNKPKFPLANLFKEHLPAMLAGILSTAIMAGLVVVAIIFMPTYLTKMMHIDSITVSKIMSVAMLINIITIFISGYATTKFAPKQILSKLILVSIILIPSSFIAIDNGYIAIGVITLGILEGVAAFVIPFLLTHLFPANVRLTGVALSYNIGFTLFGGMAPIIITSMISSGIGLSMAPIIFCCVVLVACFSGVTIAKKYID